LRTNNLEAFEDHSNKTASEKSMKTPLKWIIVAAARPNFMKIAPLLRAIQHHNRENGRHLHPILVHTGQHYDASMSDAFFRDLDIPDPDVHLDVGSGSHAEQTGKVMIGFEKLLFKETPDLVVVVGDVNSTLACTLAAVKLHIPVAHVEAGLRSFDRKMPEEINRLLTDAVSDYLFTPSPDGDENLIKEGVPREKIFLVGDIMVDSLLHNLEKAKANNIKTRLSLISKADSSNCKAYCLLTLHRPSNVDDRNALSGILEGLLEVTEKLPVIFPCHPRARKQIAAFGLDEVFEFHEGPTLSDMDYYSRGNLRRKIHCLPPFGYLEFLNLMANAKLVFTDSGGIQEETTVLGVPCITLRDSTERPITVTQGTNVLVHNDQEKIVREALKILGGKVRQGVCPEIWDGKTGQRIVEILVDRAQPNGA